MKISMRERPSGPRSARPSFAANATKATSEELAKAYISVTSATAVSTSPASVGQRLCAGMRTLAPSSATSLAPVARRISLPSGNFTIQKESCLPSGAKEDAHPPLRSFAPPDSPTGPSLRLQQPAAMPTSPPSGVPSAVSALPALLGSEETGESVLKLTNTSNGRPPLVTGIF
jgi:hypothetical protein